MAQRLNLAGNMIIRNEPKHLLSKIKKNDHIGLIYVDNPKSAIGQYQLIRLGSLKLLKTEKDGSVQFKYPSDP